MNWLAISTNKGCGACTSMRGDGSVFTPGKKSWNVEFFTMLASDFHVIEVHMSVMPASDLSQVLSISTWKIEKGKLVETVYSKSPSSSQSERVEMTSRDGRNVTRTIINKAWLEFVASQIPRDILRLTQYWPQFTFVSPHFWDVGLRGGKMFAYVAGITMEEKQDGDAAYWVPSSVDISKSEPPLATALKIRSNQISLLPPRKHEVHMPVQTSCSNLGYRFVNKR